MHNYVVCYCQDVGQILKVGATNVFQSNRSGILLAICFLYLSSKFVGNIGGNDVVGV